MGGGKIRAALLVVLAGVACGCPPPRQAVTGPSAARSMLRVGVSPDAPPVAFMRDGRIVGVEPDLAQALVNHFQRPLALVPMDWQSLIPALLAGRVDAIMSGMTITQAREVRVSTRVELRAGRAERYERRARPCGARRGTWCACASCRSRRAERLDLAAHAGPTARVCRRHLPHGSA